MGMLEEEFEFEFAMLLGGSADGGAGGAWIGVATTKRGLNGVGRANRVLVHFAWKSLPKRRPEAEADADAESSAYETGGRTRCTRV